MLKLLPLLVLPLAAQTLQSPNGKLEISFSTQPHLTYRVTYAGRPLLLPSKLGLDLQNQPPLGPALKISAAVPSQSDETYRLVTGKNNPVRNHYNSLRLDLSEPGEWFRKLSIEARAYDDGLAFRYVVPEQPSLRELRLSRENTEFHPSKDARAYPLFLKNFRTSYENVWAKLVLSRIPENSLMGLPLLLEVPGVAWMAITEADLDQYAGMYLTASDDTLRVRLSPSLDEPDLAVTGLLPHHSPWRVLLIGDEPGRLLESNLIPNLNPPCAVQDTSWIKPGKAAWSWWSGDSATGAGFVGGMDTRTMNYYTDFASSAGLAYMLVDAGWSAPGDVTRTVPAIDIPEIVRHAASKNVRVFLWLHWTAVDRQMDQAFPLYEKWGIAGVKIDFMDSNDQRMVSFYHRVARRAAEHHLMVDFHGAYPPTGMSRTYPNVLTHEGVLGLEYNKWSAVPDPDHNTFIPFTRMLAGPLDYTPGGFDNATKEEFVSRNLDPQVSTTRAHQLALFAILESPFQMVADRPGAYAGKPEFEFIRAIPTSWDETRCLSGRPGEHAVIARRLGSEWYIGAITNWNARQLELPLSFLPAGEFTAEIYSDGATPKQVLIEKKTVTRDTRLTLRLSSGGGSALRIHP